MGPYHCSRCEGKHARILLTLDIITACNSIQDHIGDVPLICAEVSTASIFTPDVSTQIMGLLSSIQSSLTSLTDRVAVLEMPVDTACDTVLAHSVIHEDVPIPSFDTLRSLIHQLIMYPFQLCLITPIPALQVDVRSTELQSSSRLFNTGQCNRQSGHIASNTCFRHISLNCFRV